MVGKLSNLRIRRFMVWNEEILIEEMVLQKSLQRVVAMAVIENPFVDQGFQKDLSLLTEFGDYLGGVLADKALEKSGLSPEEIEGIGKGCLVGEGGTIEHGAALLHVRTQEKGFGKTFRDQINGGLAIMMANVKIAGIDTTLDIPLAYKDAAFVCSHWDTITVNVPGSPKRDEIIVIAVMTNGGRPTARVPGLKIKEVRIFDGQR